jgi:hypothetical protein
VIGSAVDLQIGGEVRKLQVTGRAIFPDFERGGFTVTDLGSEPLPPHNCCTRQGSRQA